MESIKTFDEAVNALKAGDAHLKAGFAALSPEALTAIAFERINCVALARAEMASRGLNLFGQWVGYEEARRVWGEPAGFSDDNRSHRADPLFQID